MKRIKQFAALLAVAIMITGCGGSGDNGSTKGEDESAIRIEGSDTMVNLAQAWAERYQESNSSVEIEVSGGGSGVGIKSLISGQADMANASRKMKDSEKTRAKEELGKDPVELIVGRDALAVYVHKDNPIDEISLAQLKAIYADGGNITNWSDIGITMPEGTADEITRVSRQNNSGTYAYFRESVLDEEDFKLGSIDQSGSKDVVALVSTTLNSIGYSGMGYATPDVKMLKIKSSDDGDAVEPKAENVINNTYPIARPLHIYTLGEPAGNVKEYLDWIMSDAGQAVVSEMGYVPVK
ncbi:MAG TPA: phosphate-binding protein [Planctomycetaceae bacterium]|jgi:phosphate transport system substrate-binding protein|nr:phosphate-binding protein [Rhodopirellula sp.]MCH2359889.1 phosphate ABC transporter substrate-binding protein [Pirellulales bacterium]HAL14508.1 phosphate-binding protein [Planctomycetaceae bacterium]HCK72207.1 phosphate-binding protein [Planctomycetaceae bacterium]HCP84119.1 phosphate-binding protein [Planctomycetaceae bacterium]|tara:strand:- start:10251 stop:11138 length:888 start_codon:yes stop_codon:yes gene_type:complete